MSEADPPHDDDQLPTRLSTYPTSRLGPAFSPYSLVELAREVEQAGEQLSFRATAQLEVIVEQIRHLQDQARGVLERTVEQQALHRADCRFSKVPGKIYHLYKRADGREVMLMLAPGDWHGEPPHTYVGSYRLERDMTWTAAETIGTEEQVQAETTRGAIRALLDGQQPSEPLPLDNA